MAGKTQFARTRSSRQQRLRSLVLASFRQPLPASCAELRILESHEWSKLLVWLDTSGLALYFLHQAEQTGMVDRLPTQVIDRLQRNLNDNAARTRLFVEELAAINLALQKAGVVYANLKGFSVWPSSTPALELRSQLDLDLLVAAEYAGTARTIVERHGYKLHAVSGTTLEFARPSEASRSLDDLYRPEPPQGIELHLEAPDSTRPARLPRREQRPFAGMGMPVLSEADIFLHQALHLFKHISSEFTRTAHVLEFWRHLEARRNDLGFWRKLRAIAADMPVSPIALGVAVRLACTAMDTAPPAELAGWTADALPTGVRRWVERYGPECLFAGFPGNKFYLLLQPQLQKAGLPQPRSRWGALLPRRLPPLIEHAREGEPLWAAMRRILKQIWYCCRRLRFHACEGMRLGLHSLRWNLRSEASDS